MYDDVQLIQGCLDYIDTHPGDYSPADRAFYVRMLGILQGAVADVESALLGLPDDDGGAWCRVCQLGRADLTCADCGAGICPSCARGDVCAVCDDDDDGPGPAPLQPRPAAPAGSVPDPWRDTLGYDPLFSIGDALTQMGW